MVSDKATVLHVVEAYGGGVQAAISSYVENSPDFDHIIFARQRPAHDISDTQAASLTTVTGSLLQFLIQAVKYARNTNPSVIHLHSSYAGLIRILPVGAEHIVYSPHCFAFYRRDMSVLSRAIFLWQVPDSRTTAF